MTATSPIRVVVVDDHDMVRRGLATFLKAKVDLELVGEAANGEEALRVCEQTQPDVVLMDMVMPRMDGREATRAIRQRWPRMQVIALTSFKDREQVQGALQAGAIGYLLKNISTDELADAIRAAKAGRLTLSSEAAQVLAAAGKLEQLEQAVLDSRPEPSDLPPLLAEHVPSMLPNCSISVQLFPDQSLLHHPKGGPRVQEAVWEWLRTTSRPSTFYSGAELPWGSSLSADEALIVTPIKGTEAKEPAGGIYVLSHQDPDGISGLLPAVQGLAVQIGWALRKARARSEALALQRVAQEIALAGQIQASFLPSEVPQLAGWQLAATLEPARETSGDFYDFIPLPDGRWGLVVADVADKGMGAALYMALSCTLIRTYAAKYHRRPELLFKAANQRMLTDTRAGLFVSVFYGILDPATGVLDYCNAGHDPPYLLNGTDGSVVQALRRTGMPLGVMEDAIWEQATIRLASGDVLLLYTDGITDAQNQQGEFFGTDRLLEAAHASLDRSASSIRDALTARVREFAGDAPQFDDITLLVVCAESSKHQFWSGDISPGVPHTDGGKQKG